MNKKLEGNKKGKLMIAFTFLFLAVQLGSRTNDAF